MGIIRAFIVTFLSVFVLALLFPSIHYGTLQTLFAVSVILTLLQKFVRPALKILFLPINIITLGLFSWVVDVFILWAVIILVPGFHIDRIVVLGLNLSRLMSIVFASLMIGLAQSVIQILF